MTTEKWYRSYLNEVCPTEEEPNNACFNSILANYSGKIKISENNGIYDFDRKFVAFNEFTNVDGIFKIGVSIIKIYENTMITISDGDINKLNIALQTMTPDPGNGVYFQEIIPQQTPTGPMCTPNCLNNRTQSVVYSFNGKDYEYKAVRKFVNKSLKLRNCNDPNFVDVLMFFEYAWNSECERDTWVFRCKSNSKVDHSINANIRVHHNMSRAPTPITISGSDTRTKQCYASGKFLIINLRLGCVPLNSIPEVIDVCFDQFHLNATNNTHNKTLAVACN